jgi:hypothetical protein
MIFLDTPLAEVDPLQTCDTLFTRHTFVPGDGAED